MCILLYRALYTSGGPNARYFDGLNHTQVAFGGASNPTPDMKRGIITLAAAHCVSDAGQRLSCTTLITRASGVAHFVRHFDQVPSQVV